MPVLLLGAYATGIAMVRFVAPWGVTGQTLTSGLLFLTWLSLRRSRWATLPLLGILLLAGFINASQWLTAPVRSNHIGRFTGDLPLAVEARVVAAEYRSTGGYRLFTEALRLFEEGRSREVCGKILLYIEGGDLLARPGQIIRWRSKLRRPARFGNPGEFDYPLYLAAQGIHATGFIPSADDLGIVVNHPLSKSALVENLRLDLAESIRSCVPEEQAGLLQSLLLGLRGGVKPEQRRILSESGIAHLFAISGLHFGLLAILLYQVGRWLYTRSTRLVLWCPPQRILPVVLLFPLAGYLVLTGNAWATRRAFLMVGCVALLIAYGRRTPPFSMLASVALCLLICDPLALFQPGFQLSFAGVIGILAWLPGWRSLTDGMSRKFRWPLMLMLTTVAASMATLPATLWHFHLFAPAGPLSNLFAIPLIAWGAVPFGLTGMAALPLDAASAEWLLLTAAWMVDITMAGVAGITQVPWLAAIPVYMTPVKLSLLGGLLIAMLPLPSVRRRLAWRICILLTTAAAASMLYIRPADFQVTALSVGQGDATLVSLAEDVHYLVDGGGLPGSNIDPGEQLIAPALGRMGIDHLDGIVLTHNHPDHAAGLTFIVERFPVGRFYHAANTTELDKGLQRALQQHGIPVFRLDEGWSYIRQDARHELSLFVPDQKATDLNERSIAVYARQLDQRVLLTADMGRAGLRQILASGIVGNVNLLKLPHHGSRHAFPDLYLEELRPSVAFVSAGQGNPYGFPHRETIEACAKRQIPVYRTDLLGMLGFRLQNGEWQVLHANKKGFRID